MKIGTHALVSDNSGVSILKIIKVLRKPANSVAGIGDFVIGSAVRIHMRQKFKVKKGQICRALVIRTAEAVRTKDGRRVKFQYPAVVIVTKKGNPKGTKIHGPVSIKIREMGYINVVSLATIAI